MLWVQFPSLTHIILSKCGGFVSRKNHLVKMEARPLTLKKGKRRETRRIVLELLGRQVAGEEPKTLLAEVNLLTLEVDFDYLSSLFDGILTRHQELDMLIKKFLKGWRMERLNRVDHSILQIATYELMFMNEQIPPKSAINEAVELAKEFGSTEKTPGFVNAILDKIWHFVEAEKAGQA